VERLDAYLERLASDAPVPGGGSAAALVGSIGAALMAMVARIARRHPKHAGAAVTLDEIVTRSEELRAQLEAARGRDERAFEGVINAQSLPKTTQAEALARRQALDASLERAAEAPLDATALCLGVLELSSQLLDFETKSLASDIGCAAEFAYAALASCAYNVRVNHRYMRDRACVERQEALLATREAEALRKLEHVRAEVVRGLRS
jgi:formiminotetrahydrofolate cyclodeaminase